MTNHSAKFTFVVAIAALSLGVAGCSTTGSGQQTASVTIQSEQSHSAITPAAGDETVGISDPFESANRAIFKFNNGVDHALINPVIKGYRAVVPKPARTGVRNVLRNLKTPTTVANQLLQGDIGGAAEAVGRFLINSTVGVLGLVDVAAMHGMPYEQEDFGQTLGVWGVGHGPYIVAPLLGPSSLRDYTGYFVDSYADPIRWWADNTDNEGWYYAKLGVEYLDLRESLMDVLKELESSSIDYYAAVRSTYVQRRGALVADQTESIAADFDEIR